MNMASPQTVWCSVRSGFSWSIFDKKANCTLLEELWDWTLVEATTALFRKNSFIFVRFCYLLNPFNHDCTVNCLSNAGPSLAQRKGIAFEIIWKCRWCFTSLHPQEHFICFLSPYSLSTFVRNIVWQLRNWWQAENHIVPPRNPTFG